VFVYVTYIYERKFFYLFFFLSVIKVLKFHVLLLSVRFCLQSFLCQGYLSIQNSPNNERTLHVSSSSINLTR